MITAANLLAALRAQREADQARRLAEALGRAK